MFAAKEKPLRGAGAFQRVCCSGLQHDIAKAGLENLQGFGRKLMKLVIKHNHGKVGVFYKFRFDVFVKAVFGDEPI